MDDESEPDGDATVLSFADKLSGFRPLPKVLREKRRDRQNPTACRHDDIVYDRADRTMECNTCGALLDPFEVVFLLEKYYQGVEWKLEIIKNREAKDREKRKREDEKGAARRAKRLGGA